MNLEAKKRVTQERVAAAQLAQIACMVGQIAARRWIDAEYQPHPLQRFKLTKRKQNRDGTVSILNHYLDPVYLNRFRDNPRLLIEDALDYMEKEMHKNESNGADQ